MRIVPDERYRRSESSVVAAADVESTTRMSPEVRGLLIPLSTLTLLRSAAPAPPCISMPESTFLNTLFETICSPVDDSVSMPWSPFRYVALFTTTVPLELSHRPMPESSLSWQRLADTVLFGLPRRKIPSAARAMPRAFAYDSLPAITLPCDALDSEIPWSLLSWVTLPVTAEVDVAESLMPGFVRPLARWPDAETSLPSTRTLVALERRMPAPADPCTVNPRIVTQLFDDTLNPFVPPTTLTAAPGAGWITIGAADVPDAPLITSPP